MTEPLSPAPPAGAAALPTIVLDVSDLVQQLRQARSPTGIQRIQIELAAALLAVGPPRVRVRMAAISEPADDWRELRPGLFLELCRLARAGAQDAAWPGALAELDAAMQRPGRFAFEPGAFLVNLGTSWWLHNYFLNIRNAKRAAAIRYVPYVHDLIPIAAPQYCLPALVQDYVAWLRGAFGHADHLLAYSGSTREDLVQAAATLGETAADILVLPPEGGLSPPVEGTADEGFTPPAEPFVLFVGTIEPRKNHALVLRAWRRLIQARGVSAAPRLVCVGRAGWMSEPVQAELAAMTERVAVLSEVSDQALARLYRDCLFTLAPSFYEGWGLPVTEALRHGKPVLAARAPGLSEAGGDLADYFELGEEADFDRKLQRLLDDQAYRTGREAEIRARYRPRAWRDGAGALVEAVLDWSRTPARPRLGIDPPPIGAGRFYPLHRSGARRIHPGLGRGGEVFRAGEGWWWPQPWGCWTKPQPAALAFRPPPGIGRAVLHLGLRGQRGRAAACTIEAPDGARRLVRLRPNQRRWIALPLRIAPDAAEIRVTIETDAGQALGAFTQGRDGRLTGVGVLGLMLRRRGDPAAIARLLRGRARALLG